MELLRRINEKIYECRGTIVDRLRTKIEVNETEKANALKAASKWAAIYNQVYELCHPVINNLRTEDKPVHPRNLSQHFAAIRRHIDHNDTLNSSEYTLVKKEIN